MTHPLWFCHNTGAHSIKLLSHWKIWLYSFNAWTHEFTERREVCSWLLLLEKFLVATKAENRVKEWRYHGKNMWGEKKVVQCNSESHKFPHSQWAGIYQVKKNVKQVCTRLKELCLSCATLPQPEPSPFRKPKSDLLHIKTNNIYLIEIQHKQKNLFIYILLDMFWMSNMLLWWTAPVVTLLGPTE